MFCPKCGGKIKDDNSFCPLCGEALEEYKAAQAQGIQQPVPVAADQEESTDMADGTASTNTTDVSADTSQDTTTDTVAGNVEDPVVKTKTEENATAETSQPNENVVDPTPVPAADNSSEGNNLPKINYDYKKKIPVWIFIAAGGVVLLVLLIGIVVAVAFIRKAALAEPEEVVAEIEEEEEVNEVDEPEATEEPEAETSATPTPTPELELADCEVTVYYGNEYGLLSDVLVEFKKNGQVVYSDTTVNGKLKAKGLEPGDYMIRYTGADLFGDECKVTLEPGDNETDTVLLARIEDPEAAYVFITWEGSQDIDACMYNSSTGQYVKYDNPVDDVGNFIYQDNNAFRGYEILYIRDCKADYDHIIYVMDQASVQNGEPSDMEADGLRVRVYTIDGLIDDTFADKEKDAALFSPGSFIDGEFEKNAVYVDGNLSKLAGYEWTQIEKDEPGEETSSEE